MSKLRTAFPFGALDTVRSKDDSSDG